MKRLLIIICLFLLILANPGAGQSTGDDLTVTWSKVRDLEWTPRDIAIDDTGSVWVATLDDIHRLSGETDNIIWNKGFNLFIQRYAGTVYWGSGSNLMFWNQDKQLPIFVVPPGEFRREIWDATLGKDGALYAVGYKHQSKSQVWKLTGSGRDIKVELVASWFRWHTDPELSTAGLRAVALDEAGRIWTGDNRGPYMIDFDGSVTYPEDFGISAFVQDILYTDSTIFIASFDPYGSGGKLIIYDMRTDDWLSLTRDTVPESMKGDLLETDLRPLNNPARLTKFHQFLVIGPYSGTSLLIYDIAKKKFVKNIKLPKELPKGIWVRALEADPQRNIVWIGSERGNLAGVLTSITFSGSSIPPPAPEVAGVANVINPMEIQPNWVYDVYFLVQNRAPGLQTIYEIADLNGNTVIPRDTTDSDTLRVGEFKAGFGFLCRARNFNPAKELASAEVEAIVEVEGFLLPTEFALHQN